MVSMVCAISFGLFPTTAAAAIAIDASTPAIVSAGNPSKSVTTAAFNPPDTSLLLVCTFSDTSISDENVTITMSNNGAALTWTTIVERDESDAGASEGHASAHYALLSTARTGMTVTMTSNTTENGGVAMKVFVITGHDTADPIGASGEGSANQNNTTPTIYTSTVNNSRGFGCATDWNQLGTPTSTDTEFAYDLAGDISGLAAHKASDTTPSGTAVTMNFDAAGTGAAKWNWVGVEVNPAATAATPKRKKHFFYFLEW